MIRKKKLKSINGEFLEIYFTEKGQSVCPVCGHVTEKSSEAAYSNVYCSDGTIYASASMDICPECLTQFGLDDRPMREGETINSNWSVLRKRWLNEVGITKKIIDQLKNIDVYIDGEE